MRRTTFLACCLLLLWYPVSGQGEGVLTPADIVRMVESGQLVQAAEALEQKLVRGDDPALRDLALRLAELGERAGETDIALRLSRAVATSADSPRALLQQARLESRIGDHEMALSTLRRALALAPNSEDLLAARARLLLGSRSPATAIAPLEALDRMHPTVAEYPYLLGVAWMQVGDMSNAVEALERSRRIEAERPLTLIALGLAFDNQKRYEEAREALGEALRYAPDNPEALAALAEAEEGLGMLDAAEQRVRRVLARRDDHAAALRVLGMVLMKRQDYAEARKALERSVATDPAAKTHYQLSLACARLGDQEASRRHLEAYRQAQDEREEQLLALRGRRPAGRHPAGPRSEGDDSP